MAAKSYLRDQSKYLASGKLSDLTVKFGGKTWRTHKVIACCHSEWFQNALTGGFKEAAEGIITLHDDPIFAEAIDCMMSYFSKAEYTSDYDKPKSLLHAQVAIIADKYVCTSLYKLAKSSIEKIIKTLEVDESVALLAFIYDNISNEVPAHVELRNSVVSLLMSRVSYMNTILKNEAAVSLFRSNADLATDLLLLRTKAAFESFVTCSFCGFLHAGLSNCPTSTDSCPQCQRESVTVYKAHDCPKCDGIIGS